MRVLALAFLFAIGCDDPQPSSTQDAPDPDNCRTYEAIAQRFMRQRAVAMQDAETTFTVHLPPWCPHNNDIRCNVETSTHRFYTIECNYGSNGADGTCFILGSYP